MIYCKEPHNGINNDGENGSGYFASYNTLSASNRQPPRSIARAGYGWSPDEWKKDDGSGGVNILNCGLLLRGGSNQPTSTIAWNNTSDRGGSFSKRNSTASREIATGVQGEAITNNPYGLVCVGRNDDESISGPTTNNLLWNATNVSAGTGVMYGLFMGSPLPGYGRGGTIRREHTFFAQNTNNRNGYASSVPDFSAGYHFGAPKGTIFPRLRVANSSGSASLAYDNSAGGINGEFLTLIRDVGGIWFYFFSKYLIRPVGNTGNWTPVLDVGMFQNRQYGFRTPFQVSNGGDSLGLHNLPYRKTSLENFTGDNARFLEACNGTSGVATNFRMCVGGLQQTTFDSTKVANSEHRILEAYVGNDSDTAAAGKLGAIVGEVIEEKNVFILDKQGFYDVRHAGFCSAYGMGHVEAYILHCHNTYGGGCYFIM